MLGAGRCVLLLGWVFDVLSPVKRRRRSARKTFPTFRATPLVFVGVTLCNPRARGEGPPRCDSGKEVEVGLARNEAAILIDLGKINRHGKY